MRAGLGTRRLKLKQTSTLPLEGLSQLLGGYACPWNGMERHGKWKCSVCVFFEGRAREEREGENKRGRN